jgi:hypothetical protein
VRSIGQAAALVISPYFKSSHYRFYRPRCQYTVVSLGRGVPVLFSIPVVEDVEVFNKKFKMRQALALRVFARQRSGAWYLTFGLKLFKNVWVPQQRYAERPVTSCGYARCSATTESRRPVGARRHCP